MERHPRFFTRPAIWVLGGLVLALGARPVGAQTVGGDQQHLAPWKQLPKHLVADYGYWSQYNNPPYTSAQIPFSKVTQVNHAGVNLSSNADGTFVVPDGFLEPELLTRAHAAGVKVLLLVGGDPTVFSTIAADPSLRATLVANLSSFITEYGYDGVDIDWEYPNPPDRHPFVKLMAAIRQIFPSPQYLTSMDVPPWGGAGFDFKQLQTIVDAFNIMTYDYAGPWTDDGQINSPIFPDPKNPDPQGSVKQALDLLLKHLPPGQINIGSPFYGYWYKNVKKLWGNCNPCDDSTVLYEPYAPFMKERINQRGWVEYYEMVSGAPYLLRADGKRGFITFDDPASTYLRTWYSVWYRGVGGMFIWSVDQDYDGHGQELLDAMYQATVEGP